MQDQPLGEVRNGRLAVMRMLSKSFRSRRLTSFSLRTVLIAVTVFAVWLGWARLDQEYLTTGPHRCCRQQYGRVPYGSRLNQCRLGLLSLPATETTDGCC
jgi:hypothetical protein